MTELHAKVATKCRHCGEVQSAEYELGIADARAKFALEHPSCPKCGAYVGNRGGFDPRVAGCARCFYRDEQSPYCRKGPVSAYAPDTHWCWEFKIRETGGD